MQKKQEAFTLVELLIVMGILAILMTIGISVGRFAIQRANNIQHQNAADQIAQAVQSYYTDKRRYPETTDVFSPDPSSGVLDEYIDASFDGGSEATFYYDTNGTNQTYLVCVTLGGVDDADELGVYCTGDGFEDSEVFGGAVAEKTLEYGTTEYNTAVVELGSATSANWDGENWE